MKHKMEMKNIINEIPYNEISYRDIYLYRGFLDNGYGVKFGGAKTVVIGEDKGYGIFISGIKENSIALQNEDIKPGLQVIEMNGMDLEYATFYELKEALRIRNTFLKIRLKYNFELLKNYNFQI